METDWLIIFVIYGIVMAILAASIAKQKGKDPVGWFLLGLGLGVIAIIALAALPSATTTPSGSSKNQGADSEELMCSECGKPVPEGAGFCPSCGVKFDEPSCCVKCKKELPPDVSYCPWCGQKISAMV